MNNILDKANPKVPKDTKLEGSLVHLRPVNLSDATEEYVGWLNDPEVNKYLTIPHSGNTLLDLKEYVSRVADDSNTVFLAIVAKDSGSHIGNVKVGPINWNHTMADMGIMIGNKNYWGKGIASEVVELVSNFALNNLHLHKLQAGFVHGHDASIKAFTKAGFEYEATFKKHYLINGKYQDNIIMAKFNQQL